MSGARHQANDVDVDLGRLFGSLLRKLPQILGVSIIVAGLAFFFAWSSTPLFKAETRILIETRESVFTRPQIGSDAERPILDDEGVTSQVQVISSSDILRQVARELDLGSRLEFDPSAEFSPIRWLMVTVGMSRDPGEVGAEERVIAAMRKKLGVYRVEGSRVIVVEFSSEDPELAARVPNSIAQAYLSVQRDAKRQSNSAATAWLEPEIEDLSESVKQAEAKVAAFRQQSDLLIGQNNAVLATQQLSELSSELSRVRANRGAAEANAESLRSAIDDGAALESLPEVLSSSLIQRLRERQIELRAQIADLSTTLLGNHPRLRALTSQLADLDDQIRIEARKVLSGLETEAQTAASRETRLLAELDSLKGVSARANDEEVELRALERDAASQRQLLETYLTRYREAASRGDGDYLPADARVIATASTPVESYFPKIVPITLAAFVGSLVLMAIVTLVRELFSGRAMRPAARGVYQVDQVVMPRTITAQREERDALGGLAFGIERAANRLMANRVRRAVFLSPQGDEAAASSILVARSVADDGLRVLLLDLTAGGAAAFPMLETSDKPGITNLLTSEAQFTDVIHPDQYSECHVIPTGTADPETAMRAIDRLPIVLRSLGTVYDLVVVECGDAEVKSLDRLLDDDTEILVSVIEPTDAAVTNTVDALKADGQDEVVLVSPEGERADRSTDSRSAA